MSERKFSLLILPTALLLGICIGALVGRSKCRAEQKRWDDAGYQAHPVVKEVPPKFTFDGAGIASECIVLGNDRLYCNFTKGVGFTPAPPKKAKPANCNATYLKGYGDAIHWAMEANRKAFGVVREREPLADVAAKEIICEKCFGNPKPCDPPQPKDSFISCFDWVPTHEGWTCEDKQRILQQSEDGKLHCILPVPKP